MTFDKDTYWANRQAGKRGQGEKASAKLLPIPNDKHFKVGSNLRRVNGVLMLIDRKLARKRAVDRSGSKPNWKNRRKLSWVERMKQSRAASADTQKEVE